MSIRVCSIPEGIGVPQPVRRKRPRKVLRAKTNRTTRLLIGHLPLSQSAALCKLPLPAISDLATVEHSLYAGRVLELEVYAAGVRDLSKILELDIELETIPGLHYKVDRNHDIVYMELEAPTVTFREIRSIFRKLGLDPKFVGAIPAELRPKTKTQLLES